MAETLPALPVDLSDLAARAAEFARSSRSAATERAYRSDWTNRDAIGPRRATAAARRPRPRGVAHDLQSTTRTRITAYVTEV